LDFGRTTCGMNFDLKPISTEGTLHCCDGYSETVILDDTNAQKLGL
jgi:hypothetical protein